MCAVHFRLAHQIRHEGRVVYRVERVELGILTIKRRMSDVIARFGRPLFQREVKDVVSVAGKVQYARPRRADGK